MRKQAQLLKVITDVELDRIHETSLAILEEIGVQKAPQYTGFLSTQAKNDVPLTGTSS